MNQNCNIFSTEFESLKDSPSLKLYNLETNHDKNEDRYFGIFMRKLCSFSASRDVT